MQIIRITKYYVYLFKPATCKRENKATEAIARVLSNGGVCTGMHRPSGWDQALVAQDLQMLTSVNSSNNILARLVDRRGEACPPGHETDKQVIPLAPEGVLHKHEAISKLATPGHGASRSPGLGTYRGLFSDDLTVNQIIWNCILSLLQWEVWLLG